MAACYPFSIRRQLLLTVLICVLVFAHTTDTAPISATLCNISPPCHCGRNYVSCASKNLLDIPELLPLGHQSSTLSIYLQDNQLSRLPDDVFQNFSSVNASRITVDLSNNSLQDIEFHAFHGIEISFMSLNQNHNNLTTIPQAISLLTSLEVLSITHNPLVKLDPHVLSAIGGHLKWLDIDLGNFQVWPSELHLLRALTSLSLENLAFPYIPFNAFFGHEANLQHLAISNTKLQYIPAAICRLTNILDFKFNGNHFLDQHTPLFEPCGQTLTHVMNVNLEDNSLRRFPGDLFKLFPNVQNLILRNNSLYYIRQNEIPTVNNVVNLDLSSNKFTRIPYALNQMASVEFLNMQVNEIQAIDVPLDIPNLKMLMLDNNPIAYINPDAFENVKFSLSWLQLEQTDLDHIPEALAKVPSLAYVSITPKEMDCTCLTMGYLSNWYVDNVTISADTKCEISNEPVKDYIKTDLPNCQ